VDPGSAVTETPPSESRRPRKRLWVGIVAAIAVVAVAATLVVRFGPQLVAQHFVRTYLDGLNIETGGVDTLRIRLLQGYLSFGPVTFRGADALEGQVGRIGVVIDVRRLLQRQALVKSIIIEGVRFEVRQADDGSFSLNGIPLAALLADQAKSSAAREPAPDHGAAEDSPPSDWRTLQDDLKWHAGLEALEIRDSRVVYLDNRGGEAVAHVHQLDLAGFRSWTPEKPGKYSLNAELNEIALTASGTATPFADKIEVTAEAAVTGIKVQRIERFLGPLGFTSRAGQVDLALSNVDIALFAAGRVDASLAATGTMTGVDLAHPIFGSGRLATGALRLDNVSLSYGVSRETTLACDLDIDLQSSALKLENGTEASFARARFGLPGTVVKTVPGKQPELKVAPQLDVDDLRLSGAYVQGSVGKAAARLNGFSIEGTEPGSPFLANGSVSIERIDLRLPKEVPITVVADRVGLDLADTQVAFLPGRGTRIDGGLAVDTRRLALRIDQAASPGQPDRPATRVEAGKLLFEMPVLAFDNTTAPAANMSAKGARFSVNDLQLDGADVRGRVGQASVSLASVEKMGADEPLVASGSVAADGLDLLLPGAEPVAIAAGQIRAELAETRLGLAPGTTRLAGGLSLDTRALFVSIQEQARRGQPPPPPTRIEAARLAVAAPTVTTAGGDAVAAADAVVRVANPRVTVDRLRLGGADIQGTIGQADLRLASVDVEANSAGAPVVATGRVTARDMDLLIPDAEPIAIVANQVDADLTPMRFVFPSGRVLIDGAVALDSNALSIMVHQRGDGDIPAPPPIGIFASRFTGDVPRLKVEDSRATGTRVKVTTPGMTLDRFRLLVPKKKGAALQLGASALTLRRIDVDVVDAETLEVAGQGDISAPDLSLRMSNESTDGEAPASQATVGRFSGLDLGLKRFSYRGLEDGIGFGLQGRIGLAGLEGEQSSGRPGETADRVSASRLKLDVDDFDIVKGGKNAAWHARLDLDLGSMKADISGPLSLRTTVDDVLLNRLDTSSDNLYALGSLTIGRVDAAMTRLPTPGDRSRHDTPAAEEPATGTWPPADLPTVRVGRLALAHGARIGFVDAAVAPPVDTTLTVDSLNLTNLDTANPDARADLLLRARLGEADIRLQGWAEAFRSEPNFVLRLGVDDLPLRILSPYFGPAIGLDIFRGNLTLAASADASADHLDGDVRARFVGVRMADRRDPATGEIPRSIAIPLSRLIRLLEDGEGSIEVRLPVRGTLASPDLRYTSAVWTLLPTVLRAFVSSPVEFVSSTVSLVGAATADSAAPPTQAALAGDDRGGAPR